jgi:predicted aspartyl protease
MAADPGFSAFTLTAAGGLLRELKSTCFVTAAFDPKSIGPNDPKPIYSQFNAIWDTGATGTVITQKVVDACGLKAVSVTRVVGAYGGEVTRPVFLVNMGLPNQVGVHSVEVSLGEMANADVLIGMNIITLGDFAITNQRGVTVFSFRIPSKHTIDYVANWNAQRAAAQNPIAKKKARKHK